MSSENTKNKTIVGVDYSMNGPAFAVISDDYVNIKYWTNKKKYGEVSIEICLVRRKMASLSDKFNFEAKSSNLFSHINLSEPYEISEVGLSYSDLDAELPLKTILVEI